MSPSIERMRQILDALERARRHPTIRTTHLSLAYELLPRVDGELAVIEQLAAHAGLEATKEVRKSLITFMDQIADALIASTSGEEETGG